MVYCCMCLCTVAGLAGDNDLQNAEIGSLMDFVTDIGKNCENVMKETDKEKQVSIYTCISNTCHTYSLRQNCWCF